MKPIQSVTLRAMAMRMRAPFQTSFGSEWDKHFILVEIKDTAGNSGWGESVAMRRPFYSEETTRTVWHMLQDELIPLLWRNEIRHPEDLVTLFHPIRRNNMAKAALEGAVWDLYAQEEQVPLAQALGGTKRTIEVGISIGIQKSPEKFLDLIGGYVAAGYRRIKIKIMPGWDVNIVAKIRDKFPDIRLMADANSAYSLKDAEHLAELDTFNLMMIEQPLAYDDIIDHAVLQKKLHTPICLDESIHSLEDARKAVEMGSCGIINIKIGRVGGLTEARRIQEYCRNRNIPVWCGGMLESGIGRAHNIAVTTLPGFTLPGDTASSSRYWERDLITPEVIVKNGIIEVPNRPGIGYTPDRDAVDAFTLAAKTFRPSDAR